MKIWVNVQSSKAQTCVSQTLPEQRQTHNIRKYTSQGQSNKTEQKSSDIHTVYSSGPNIILLTSSILVRLLSLVYLTLDSSDWSKMQFPI